jgi:capsular polysaccharide biosynthesis protein
MKRRTQLKDHSSMSKEELASNIEELKANLEIIDNAFKDIKNISPKISDEVVSKLQGELNKTREGIAKLEKLLSE